MHRGLFEDAGPAEDVFDHPQSDYTKNLLAAVPDVRRSLTARARP
jgi:microcin C transport system ATP-binding protein